MKTKKLISVALALIMMLALTVPAMAKKPDKGNAGKPALAASYAVDKIEGEDPRKPIVENGAEINTAGWPEIYIKQANDVFIWVAAGDTRSEAEIIAQARANDKSLDKEGKGSVTVVVGPNGSAVLHGQTYVSVIGGILTVNGPISHIDFAGNPAPEFPTDPEPTPVNATINIQKLIEAVAPTYESFTFQILDAEGSVVGTITTDKQTGKGSTTVNVLPGTYTIHEVMTDSQALRFTAADMSVEITADEDAVYSVDFVNTPNGETSTVFGITKYLNVFGIPGAGFVFGIYAADGTKIGNMTSDETGLAATEDFWVEPGTYTIREIEQDTDAYEVNNEIITVTVDESGGTTYVNAAGEEANFFTNYAYGSLDIGTPVVKEKYDELWHTPVYEAIGRQGTMVSIPTNMVGTEKNLPAGITDLKQSGPKDGFTYVQINKTALVANEDGATIGIVKKVGDMSDSIMAGLTIPKLNPLKPWGDARLATYTLKLSADGETLYLESTLPDFRLTFSKTNSTPVHQGGHEGENVQPDENGLYTYSYSLSKYGVGDVDEFRVMVHYDNKGYNTGNVINCNSTTTISRECERVYEGEVTVTVKNAAGETVTDLAKLPHGDYTVIVTAGDQELYNETITVNPGEEAKVTFDEPFYLTEKGAPEYKCANPNCDLNKTPLES